MRFNQSIGGHYEQEIGATREGATSLRSCVTCRMVPNYQLLTDKLTNLHVFDCVAAPEDLRELLPLLLYGLIELDVRVRPPHQVDLI